MIYLILLLIIIGVILELYAFRSYIFKKEIKGGNKMSTENRRSRKEFMLRTLVLVISCLIALNVVVMIADMTGPSFTFNQKVHGHMQNAYDANSPELMKSELQLAIQGMKDLELEEDMYGALFPWERTPDRTMSYQYRHLEGIIERIDAVIEWREKTYAEGSMTTEQLGDVFEEKMDNLRAFLKEDTWSDWIARDAYYINHNLPIYILSVMGLASAISFAIVGLFVGRFIVIGFNTDFEFVQVYSDETKKWKWYNETPKWHMMILYMIILLITLAILGFILAMSSMGTG